MTGTVGAGGGGGGMLTGEGDAGCSEVEMVESADDFFFSIFFFFSFV